jgi:NADH-quinone oxidoreductase subunit M
VLWYGYIYYFLFMIILFISLIFFFRLLFLTVFNQFNLVSILSKNILSFFIFFSFISFLSIYNFLDFFTSFNNLISTEPLIISNIDFLPHNYIWNTYNLNLNLLSIYYFPFIYIFIVITVISILFCLSYNLTELMAFMFYCTLILIAGLTLFFTDSIILFFFAYEMLLVPSFFILYNFAKTRRCVEAAYLMFFWTQFGALFLIFGFLYLFFICGTSSFSVISLFYFTPFELNFLFACFIFGFGVKFPIWPFYGWLPKAHVEASTNFSIFLSGVLVKFAFFGLLKCLITLQLEPTFYYIYPFLFIGIVDAVFKLFYQVDLKKLVAYSTVVEMHWLTICIISGHSPLMLASFCMLISHALLSTNSFLLVDAIGRRFKTRLVTEINGVNFLCPKLFLVSLINLLVFLGFPGSIMFVTEILFFGFFFDLFPLLCLILIVLLYLLGPTFFFRSWVNVLFGSSVFFSKTLPIDLTFKELLLYGGLLILMYWLGITWQAFIF